MPPEPQFSQPSQNVPSQGITVEYAHAEQNDFIHRVYGWMGIGLLVTAVISYVVASTPSLIEVFVGNLFVFYGLVIVELLAVSYLARATANISSSTAGMVFLAYSALNGLTFSIIFLIYDISSIGSVFLISAATFGLVSMYGFFTKRDLTTVGHLAFMGLIGIVIASLVNLFFLNDTTSLVISYISVVVFVGLIAYDNQKLKALNGIVEIGSETEKKEAIVGALALYLDFINLFLSLLRILGKRRR